MTEGDPTVALEFDRSVLGVEVDIGTHQVTEEEVVAYARSLGETDPLYVDPAVAAKGPHGAVIAPTGFYTYMRFRSGPDAKVRFGNIGFIAGQRVRYYEHIRAGDSISARAQIADVYAKTGRTGQMVFVVTRTTYVNQHGRTVMEVDNSNVRRQVEP